MSDPTQPDRRRRYALVGAGHRAKTYIDALAGPHAADGRLVALCDPNSARMRYYGKEWAAARPAEPPPAAYSDKDFGALLERERPDAVIVASVDSTHHRYIVEALDRGLDVVVEKPLTTDEQRCGQIVRAALRSDGELVVAFNYRYSPRNAAVKELLDDGAIGRVTSVHFEWVLDTVHGADYFRRWHREKASSGGLLVHKSSHHFDLVHWWLATTPETVFAFGDLRFYGRRNAVERGLRPEDYSSRAPADSAAARLTIDLAADDHLRQLYLEAEHEDGYLRDRNVFDDGIAIEDNIAAVVRYANRAILTYSLNAHSPWEGYRVAFNGTEGRLELAVCERAAAAPGTAADVLGAAQAGQSRQDSAGSARRAAADAPDPRDARPEGTQLIVQRHWEPAQRIEVTDGPGGHGGGDALLLDDIFRGDRSDPLGQRAGYADGARSMLVGVAANRSIETGQPVAVADLGVPLEAVARAAARRSARRELKRLLRTRSG